MGLSGPYQAGPVFPGVRGRGRLWAWAPVLALLMLSYPAASHGGHEGFGQAKPLLVLVYESEHVDNLDANGSAQAPNELARSNPHANLPFAIFNGNTLIEGRPRWEGGWPGQEAANAYLAAYERNSLGEASFTVTVEARLENRTLTVDERVEPMEGADPDLGARLRVLIFRHDQDPAQDSGAVVLGRVSSASSARFVNATASSGRHTWEVPANFSLRPFGVAAVLQQAPAGRTDPIPAGDVLGAAWWLAGQEGATVQTVRPVLLEVATTTPCDACWIIEDALPRLAQAVRERLSGGPQGAPLLPASPWTPWLVAATAGVATAGVLVPRSRLGGRDRVQ